MGDPSLGRLKYTSFPFHTISCEFSAYARSEHLKFLETRLGNMIILNYLYVHVSMALKTSSGPPVFQVSESCLQIFKAPLLRDRPITRTTHTQRTSQTYIQTTSGNQTHDDSVSVAEDITLLTTRNIIILIIIIIIIGRCLSLKKNARCSVLYHVQNVSLFSFHPASASQRSYSTEVPAGELFHRT